MPESKPLIDELHLRSSVMKRLFQRGVPEMVAELLQNSQRAGATEVKIKIPVDIYDLENDSEITYEDNGHGILNGMDGWWHLLAVASSYYEDTAVMDQDPMGLGLNALLTADEVERVKIYSGSYYCEIDRYEWWNTPEYYNNWEDRVKLLSQPFDGFGIQIFTKSSRYRDDFTKCLPTLGQYKNSRVLNAVYIGPEAQFLRDVKNYPALGYDGVFSVSLNDQAVYNGLPRMGFTPVLETTYQGNKLIVGTGGVSVVRWYGQMIVAPNLYRYYAENDLSFYLDVKEGTPLTPKAPTRDSILEDFPFTALKEYAIEELFNWSTREDSEMTNSTFTILKTLGRQRFIDTSAWFSYYKMSEDGDEFVRHLAQYRYPPVLWEKKVEICRPDLSPLTWADTSDSEGIHNFCQEIENSSGVDIEFRTLGLGDDSRLPKAKQLTWVLGEDHEKMIEVSGELFSKPGSWAESNADLTDLILHEFSNDASLYFFEKRTEMAFSTAGWVAIGTNYPVDWLEDNAHVGYDEYNESEDYPDKSEEGFYESIETIIREYRGGSVTDDYTYADLERYVRKSLSNSYEKRLEILSVDYLREKNIMKSIRINFRTGTLDSKCNYTWDEPQSILAKVE